MPCPQLAESLKHFIEVYQSFGLCDGANPRMLSGFYESVFEFVRSHQVWTGPILFALAFGESVAFVSLFVPAWAIIVSAGALSEAGVIPFWTALVGATAGAALGDWFSYWLGGTLRGRLARTWPFANNPSFLSRAEAFMRRWGTVGVFAGRFFGPLRATVPMAAGILGLPYWRFQFANVTSALAWSAVLLNAGRLGLSSFVWLIGS
jgi:membrane protein DedA with SNARE-associated domain